MGLHGLLQEQLYLLPLRDAISRVFGFGKLSRPHPPPNFSGGHTVRPKTNNVNPTGDDLFYEREDVKNG
jgi:hypothetical protein